MRSSKSRSRSKSNRQQRSLGNIINRVFDSSGPEGKVRGTPQQIIDKYLMLARDAQLGNDRVAEQAFLQHAEHYTRMLGEAQREMAREQESRQGQHGNGNGQSYQGGGDRGDGPRDRQDQRQPRDEEDEQPDFAPLGAVAGDVGPELVETPEMRHAARDARQVAAQPAADPSGATEPSGGGERHRPRNDRAPRGPRKPRAERVAQPAEDSGTAGPVATEASDSE